MPHMRIQVTRPFWYAGGVVPVGTVLSLPTVLAAELVHNGKATPYAEPAAATAADTPATTPATTPAATPAAPAARAKAARKATSPTPLEATP